jgi:hypothetical protein
MTQEEEDLLIKEFCTREYSKLKCYAPDDEYGNVGILYSIDPFEKDEPNVWIQYSKGNIIAKFISEVKPYLRPMSSMTIEEKFEYNGFDGYIFNDEDTIIKFDWLNKHHFDYRGLIESGLALEAPEGMYVIE